MPQIYMSDKTLVHTYDLNCPITMKSQTTLTH